MLIFFIWSISQNSNANSKFRTLLVCFKRGKFVKIVLQVSVFLTSRVRAPFRPGIHDPTSLKGIDSYYPEAQHVRDCLRLYFSEQTFYFSSDHTGVN